MPLKLRAPEGSLDGYEQESERESGTYTIFEKLEKGDPKLPAGGRLAAGGMAGRTCAEACEGGAVGGDDVAEGEVGPCAAGRPCWGRGAGNEAGAGWSTGCA